MKAKQLAQVIRKLVKEEVQKAVQEEVRSILGENNTQKQLVDTPNTVSYTKHTSLNEALNATEAEEYQTVKSFNAGDARAGFASLQNNIGGTEPTAFTGHNGQVIPASKLDDSLTKSLTRDYSELVKRFKK